MQKIQEKFSSAHFAPALGFKFERAVGDIHVLSIFK